MTLKMVQKQNAEIAALKAELSAVRELMNCYNLGGWTDPLEPMQRAIKAEAELAALKASASETGGKPSAGRIKSLADKMADRKVAIGIPTGQLYRGVAYDQFCDAREELFAAIDTSTAPQPAPAREPVAWRYELKAGEYTFAQKRYLDETYAPRPTPLYTAPPNTDELVAALRDASKGTCGWQHSVDEALAKWEVK